MPRYELQDAKFWEVEVEGNKVIRRHGSIGGKGRRMTHTYPSALAARCYAEASILDKRSEGFRLVGEKEPWPGPGREGEVHPELERRLEADPRDAETALVYGDWLQARGDPRGELITVQHEALAARGERAKQLAKAEERLLDRYGAELLGELREVRDLFDLDWNVGFIRAARLGAARGGKRPRERVRACFSNLQVYWVLEAMVVELFSLRSARFIEALSLESVGSDIYPLDVVIERAPPTLHTLELPMTRALGATLRFQDDLMLDAEDQGIWLGRRPIRLPGLRTLRIAPPLQHHTPHEEDDEPLQRWHGGGSWDGGGSGLGFVCSGALPSLETLSLCCSGPDSALEDVKPILEGACPGLTHLGMQRARFAGELCDRLRRSRLLPRLRVLDLGRGTFDDADAQRVAAHASDFRHLERLDLTGTAIGQKGLEALAGAGVSVVAAAAGAPAPPPAAGDAPVTHEQVIGLCPDKRAEAAARGLASPDRWKELARDGARAWGRCKGSSGHYEVVGSLRSLRVSCDCPSRKRPCKHSLALLMLVADGKVENGTPPGWVR